MKCFRFLRFATPLLSVVALGFSVLSSTAASPEKPNVLIIYTDDQGSVDAGCYGSDDLITPNIDALAARGVRFTQMYAPSAICSSSRAGLMTGRFPYRAGVPGNVSSAKGHDGMPVSEFTLAEMMKTAGYTTGQIGKWHLGYTPATMPNGQGFDYSFGHMGGCIDNYSHFFYWNGPNRHDLWRNGTEIWEDGKYFGDLMVDEMKAFVSHNRSRPWFAYWAINFPHYPLQATAKWRKAYEGVPEPRNMYGAFVSTMDEMIGEVLEHLQLLGLEENTLIIFQSDHGHSTEERTFFGGGSAGPYRGAKGCLFEGGIRVPSIVSWPARFPQGEVRDQMVTGCDWFPTLAEVAGVKSVVNNLDGKSILPVIQSGKAKTPHERFYWHLGGGKGAQWVVREGDWKLLGNPRDRSDMAPLTKDDSLFLVNLSDDIQEMKNVAQQHPDVVKRLSEAQATYLKSIEGK